MPHKIVVTRTLPPGGAALLNASAASGAIEVVQWEPDTAADRSWLLTELRKGGVDGMIVFLGDKIDEEVIEAAGTSLKAISTMSAGYDHITLSSLAKRNIVLGTTPDALTDATADIGAMLVLMASRRAGEGLRAVVNGKWPAWSPLLLCGHALQKVISACLLLHFHPHLSSFLRQSTVGVLGFGKIGQLTLKRLLGFGIGRALYTTSQPGATLPPSKDYFNLLTTSTIPIRAATSLDELAAESDFLIICCALTPETENLISADFLSKMKKTAYIVNTARGPVVDSDALVKAIEEGKLAGAGLDVVTGEPNIPADHPLVKNEKVVLLPHIGSATLETRNLMAEQSVQNLLAGLGLEGGVWANEVKL